MNRQAVRNGLFRLAMALKVLTWVAIGGALVIGFRDAATGRELVPPTVLLYAIGVLVAAQLIAIVAWRIARGSK